MTTTTDTSPETPDAPAPTEDEAPKENPRTKQAREKLALACGLIANFLAHGEWVSSNDIHKKFSKQISEGMFGRAKSELGIVHRRVRDEKTTKARYEWQLPEERIKELKASGLITAGKK